jgi:hypothetical protein
MNLISWASNFGASFRRLGVPKYPTQSEYVRATSQSASPLLEVDVVHETSKDFRHDDRPPRMLRKLHLPFVFSCLLLIVSLATLAFLLAAPPRPSNGQFPLETRSFSPTPRERSDETWKCLPNGNGLAYLDSAAARSLPPGLPSGDGQRNLYGISWTHQLYCLSVIRSHLYLLSESQSSVDHQHNLSLAEHQSRLDHLETCFDYLRQKIFCIGDMTLEWPTHGGDPNRSDHDFRIDGFGIEHRCSSKVGFNPHKYFF